MKESVILQMRSTIFMTCFISYTEEAKVQYSDLLPDAHPEAFLPSDPLNQNSLAPTEYGPWKLTNGNLSINFGQGRVDIEQKIVVEPDSAEIFLRKCKEIFKAIVTRESKKNASIRIFRFAFAPVIAFDFNNDETKDSIASKLFVNNKFKDSDFDNAELSAAFKVQEKLDDKFINMNYYYRFGFGEKRQNNKGEAPLISDCAIMEIDINTATDEKMDFDSSSIEDFFSKVISKKKEFIQFIINGI